MFFSPSRIIYWFVLALNMLAYLPLDYLKKVILKHKSFTLFTSHKLGLWLTFCTSHGLFTCPTNGPISVPVRMTVLAKTPYLHPGNVDKPILTWWGRGKDGKSKTIKEWHEQINQQIRIFTIIIIINAAEEEI